MIKLFTELTSEVDMYTAMKPQNFKDYRLLSWGLKEAAFCETFLYRILI